MNTEGGGKIKTKRPLEENKPYSRRKSWLRNIGAMVSSVLSPSWFDLKSKKNGSEYSETDLQNEKSQQLTDGVPSTNSSLFMSNNSTSHSSLTNDHLTNYNTHQLHYPTYNNMVNGNIGDSHVPNGYPNLHGIYPPLNRRDFQHDMFTQKATPHRDSLYGSNIVEDGSVDGSSIQTNEESFLWSNKAKSHQSVPSTPSSQSHCPSFNVDTFGSNASADRISFFGNLPTGESPFYRGKTVYGGAASQSRARSLTPHELNNSRTRVKAKSLSTTDNNSGLTSSTAKQILDTLNRMSTPLTDAKKIPSFDVADSESLLSFTPSIKRRSSMKRQKVDDPPTENLGKHEIASIAENKSFVIENKKIQVEKKDVKIETISVPKVQPVIKQDISQKENVKPFSCKMRKERQHYSSKEPEEEIEVPLLSTAYTLPIKNLSNIDFLQATTSTPLPKPKPSVETYKSSELHSTTDEYSFSSPIHIKDYPTNFQSEWDFKFCSPIHNEISTSSPADKDDTHPVSCFSSAVFESKTLPAPIESKGKEKINDINFNHINGPILSKAENKSNFQFDLSKAVPKKSTQVKPSLEQDVSIKIPVSSIKSGSVMD